MVVNLALAMMQARGHVVILDADPLADVQNLSRIHRVIKDGKLFAPGE